MRVAHGQCSALPRRHYSSGRGAGEEEHGELGKPLTPWVRQVISGVDLMRHPKFNKGLGLQRGGARPALPARTAATRRAVAGKG